MRTQTVPNHVDGHRDVKWGMDAKIALAGVILGLIGTFITLAGGIWYFAAKLTSMEERLAATQSSLHELNSDLKVRIDEAAKQHASFVTRDELEDRLADVKADRRPR